MPIYEYQCQACGHRLEAIQKISDPPLETCPECSGQLAKQISAPAFQFKGSGWYVTDYAGKKGGGESEGGSSKSGANDGSGSGGSDSKSGGKGGGASSGSSDSSGSAGSSGDAKSSSSSKKD